MSVEDFENQERLTQEIVDAVAAWEDPYNFGVTMQNPNTKYKASSAMQKCLRRGFAKQAVYYAEALLNSPVPDYLWNRLPLVVLEDVGLGNWKFCAYAIHLSRFSKVRKMVDLQKATHWLIHHLTLMPKSRSLSEAVCFAYFCNEPAPTAEIHLIGSNMQALGWKAEYEETPQSPWLQRLDAVEKAELYDQIADQTDDIYIKYSFHAGTKKNVAYQNAAIPYILYLMKTSPLEVITTHFPEPKMLHKFPYFAYDKHTLEGKAALRKMLAKNVSWLQGVTLDQLAMCLFQQETAPLDLELSNTALLQMKERSENYELLYTGLDLEQGYYLRNMLQSEEGQALLNHCRESIFIK